MGRHTCTKAVASGHESRAFLCCNLQNSGLRRSIQQRMRAQSQALVGARVGWWVTLQASALISSPHRACCCHREQPHGLVNDCVEVGQAGQVLVRQLARGHTVALHTRAGSNRHTMVRRCMVRSGQCMPRRRSRCRVSRYNALLLLLTLRNTREKMQANHPRPPPGPRAAVLQLPAHS